MNPDAPERSPISVSDATPVARPVLFRLLCVAVAAVFTVHLIGALVIAQAASRAEEHQLDERLATILDARAKVMATPLWKMQYETLGAMLRELVSDPAIVAASVYDDAGGAVAAATSDGEPGPTAIRSQAIVYQDGNISAAAGRLDVTLTRAPISAAFWGSLWNALLLALLATAAIAIGLWIATQRYIGRPLTLIASAIERSRLDGHRHRVNFDSDDEFGAVARAFNAMQVTAERNEHALHAANRRLDFLALHDELTGLPNRRSFEEQLRTTAAAMNAASGTLAVHFIDLDDFKAVNDTLGHASGDKLLRHVGRLLRTTVDDMGFVARFGGDEFVVLQRDVADETGARDFAERLMEAIRQPCTLHSSTIRTGASIGVALMDGSQSDVVRLLSLADIALYEAKRENRGTISFLTSAGRDQYNRRRRMEIDIKIALEERQFTVFFQPQVSLDTGKPVGLEALVRWQHPVEGLIGPADFLPLVDEMGLGTRLGAVIIDEACRSARQLRDKGHVGIRVAINLSGAQILDRNLVALFEEKMAQYDLLASALEVEITEVALIRDPHNAKIILSDLRTLGISVALDDFGTGYSSLAYLRHFPIDRIKLDRSFVQELPEFKETAAIVRAICALSQALDVELVAEGIERDVEAAFLRGEGIKIGQGYLYCRAHPLDEICVWLGQHYLSPARPATPAKALPPSKAA
jgi:diguanylate cyclase (GGDEF)-like protein